ncbi:hypothetical protein [Burkholderia sp. JP2-270]|uniref:hypothetical protein n=1 Tax=Burkholderia sp. JP2-270 TaxID=2217913 RepID=UPI0013A6AC7A|nr:hypothetical protein [Burkholderia sp. JP2-270]
MTELDPVPDVTDLMRLRVRGHFAHAAMQFRLAVRRTILSLLLGRDIMRVPEQRAEFRVYVEFGIRHFQRHHARARQMDPHASLLQRSIGGDERAEDIRTHPWLRRCPCRAIFVAHREPRRSDVR